MSTPRVSIMEIHHGEISLTIPVLHVSLQEVLMADRQSDFFSRLDVIGGLAIDQGFTEASSTTSTLGIQDYRGSDGLLSAVAFFHPGGSILAIEEWKNLEYVRTRDYRGLAVYSSLEEFEVKTQEFRLTPFEKVPIQQFLIEKLPRKQLTL